MPRVERQVAKHLIRLACAKISQDCWNKYEFKRKRKWVKRWSVDFISAHAAFNRFFRFINFPPATIFYVVNFFPKPPRHVTRDQHQFTCGIAFLSSLPWHYYCNNFDGLCSINLQNCEKCPGKSQFQTSTAYNKPAAAASFQFTFPRQVFFRTIETIASS